MVLLDPGQSIGKIFKEWLPPIPRLPTAYVIQYALGIILSSGISSFDLPIPILRSYRISSSPITSIPQLLAHEMSSLPIKMDLDSLNDGSTAPNHIPRTHDWDWATLRQHPLRDFETVKTSHELTMSHLKDFQDILYGKKCFVLQNPENKNMTWGSVANDFISQSLQRKGPRVAGQSEEFQESACLDWIKTVQGLKAGLFKSYESDEGGIVYRGDLKGCQVEISATEMALLNTFSMENVNVPSIRDQRMELEIRRTFLESFQELARQVKGKLS